MFGKDVAPEKLMIADTTFVTNFALVGELCRPAFFPIHRQFLTASATSRVEILRATP
jgi:hypothetical protein